MLKYFLLKLIHFYKIAISPFIPASCRYRPSCADYTSEAIRIHGVLKGIGLGMKRILRCHPWGGWGYDPVPPKQK